jgi:hypothetical protein
MAALIFFLQSCPTILAFVDELGIFTSQNQMAELERTFETIQSENKLCESHIQILTEYLEFPMDEQNDAVIWSRYTRIEILRFLQDFDINLELLIDEVEDRRIWLTNEEYVEVLRMLDILGAEERLKKCEAEFVHQLCETSELFSVEERYGSRLPVRCLDDIVINYHRSHSYLSYYSLFFDRIPIFGGLNYLTVDVNGKEIHIDLNDVFHHYPCRNRHHLDNISKNALLVTKAWFAALKDDEKTMNDMRHLVLSRWAFEFGRSTSSLHPNEIKPFQKLCSDLNRTIFRWSRIGDITFAQWFYQAIMTTTIDTLPLDRYETIKIAIMARRKAIVQLDRLNSMEAEAMKIAIMTRLDRLNSMEAEAMKIAYTARQKAIVQWLHDDCDVPYPIDYELLLKIASLPTIIKGNLRDMPWMC